MEALFEQACSDGTIPGVVLMAQNKAGTFKYERAFGARSLDPAWGSADHRPPLKFDTLMRIASASKLVTSVAAMQCVDRGLIGLDDDVRPLDPDLRGIKLLTGFDENDQPVLVAPREKITMRRLLSHSAGLDYGALSPLLIKWRQMRNLPLEPTDPKLADRYLNPLVSEPGTEWVYSSGVDWAGRIVERVSGQSLEEFVQTNIATPLGLKKMTFFPQKHPELLRYHADMTVRDTASGQVVHDDEPYWHTDPEDAIGGARLFTTPADYFEVLLSLLKSDERLLSNEALKEMLSPQLTKKSKDYLQDFMKREFGGKKYEEIGMGAFFPSEYERDHALAGMYLVEEVPVEVSPRRPGTVAWMGLPNFYWFIDPASGLCALFASQVKPPSDEPTRELMGLFEKTMYERLREAEKGPRDGPVPST